LVDAVFTDEDKRNLKVKAEELPKPRSFVEELMETLEVLSDEKLMKSIKTDEKDVQKGICLALESLIS
jgi:hypothetical protein